MYVVAGVTGNTGSVAAHALLDAGERVRVIVREASKAKPFVDRGAEVAVTDLNDENGLTHALHGAKGAYLLSPPDLTATDFLADRRRLVTTFASAVEASGLPHVVFLSSIGAQHAEGTGIIQSVHAGEAALASTKAATTFIRAAAFAENWASVLPVAKGDGVLPSFAPKALVTPTVAAKDIGVVVARVLLEGPRPGKKLRVIELGGPADVSPEDVASALSRVLGRQVVVAEAPLQALVPTYTSFGISENIATLFRQMNEGVINGTVAWEKNGTEALRGTTTVEQALGALLQS
jgi:uncharacterized protein YbjT (DUF2867 family)